MEILRRMAASLCAPSFVLLRGGRRSKVQEQYPRPSRPSSCGKERCIETTRLRLRRLRPSDEPDLVALDSDPDVMRFVGSPPGVKSPEETLARVRQRIGADQGGLGFWRVESRADGAFYGLAALIRMPAGDDVELAYRLTRLAWGQGIASEAGAILLDHAFRTLGLPRVVAVTYPENRPSQRVLGKLGFARQGDVDYKGVRATFYVLERRAE
jgi:RimJ/RimL family protein N-acetyltransferase